MSFIGFYLSERDRQKDRLREREKDRETVLTCQISNNSVSPRATCEPEFVMSFSVNC